MSKKNDIINVKPKNDPSITGHSTQEQSRSWSITINNPTQEDIDAWTNATSLNWVKEVVGQLERGANGTLHIQGLLKTDKVRFSQVKKAFPRAHIEAARSVTALAKYVVKEDTRLATLTASKVCTPQIVQQSLSKHVIQLLAPNSDDFGVYNVWTKVLKVDAKFHWVKTVAFGNPLTPVDTQNRIIDVNTQWILEHADTIVDSVVNKLIREGYYQVEFVLSNNQVRSAYKRYLPSIIIRVLNASETQLPQETSNPQGETSNPPEVD